MAQILSFLSGKGGTGKSSLCAAMAIELARCGKKVLCIDCAVGLPNLDIPLGMESEGCISFLDVCRGDYGPEKAAAHPLFPGVRLLTAPIHCDPADVDAVSFRNLTENARKLFDYILLDAPGGTGSLFTLCGELADLCIVVTLPDPGAIRAARRVSDALELMKKSDVRMVVNRVSEKMLKAMGLTVDDMVDRTGLRLLGLLPVDTDVLEAAAAGTPLIRFTQKGAAAAVSRICSRMEGNPVKIPGRSF